MNQNKKIQDLIKDKSFLNWVHKTNQEDMDKWNTWKEDNPEREEILEDAKAMVSGFSFKEKPVEAQKIDDNWAQLASKINESNVKKSNALPLRRQLLRLVAAVLMGAVLIWGLKSWFVNATPELITYQTQQMETKTFELPDGSEVILNTNSSIKFYDNFFNQEENIILLEGEAYFDIEKQTEGKSLQIKTKDLSIEIVGTAFNVNAKREQPIVSLVEGKLKLSTTQGSSKNLVAGQTAWYDTDQNDFEIVTNKTNYWKAWTMQKWSFGEQTPFQEVLDRIKETYGYQYQVNDSKILEKKASGDISVENEAILFEALSLLLDIEIKKQNNLLIISSLE